MKRYLAKVFLFLIWDFTFCVFVQAQGTTLNAAWEFVKSEAKTPAELGKQDWYTVNIPHSWNIVDGFDEENGYYKGPAWYKKEINIRKTGQDNFFLKFEGANQVTELFVNGKKVGKHLGGYAGFVFDITSFINWDTQNELLVRVDNAINPTIPPLSADFTFYGGIYRDIWAIRKDQTYFDITDGSTKGIYVSQETNKALGKLSILTKLKSSSAEKQKKLLRYTLLDKDLKGVVTTEEKVTVENGMGNLTTKLELPNPNLWSPDNPYLYTLTIELVDPKTKQVEDNFSEYVGFRWFGMAEDRSFMLNGETIKLIGTNHHQDFPNLANALPDHIFRNDLQKLKDMGANFIRIAHYQHDPSFLETCDKLGLLAWEETPLVNYITPYSEEFVNNSIAMLQELIRQHYNHPSIVMWGYMNEILLRQKIPLNENKELTEKEYHRQVARLAAKLDSVCKAEDPYRLTTIANAYPYERTESANLNEVADINSWNLYYGWYLPDYEEMGRFVDEIHAKHPTKGIIISEYGAGADPRLHSGKPWRFDFSIEGETEFHTSYFKQIMERPHVGGAAVWNFADFGSEARYDAVPSINNKGLLTFDRQPKDAYLFYQAALLKTPYLKIGSQHWRNRSGIKGESDTQLVYVFSNQEKIEVSVNGKSLGNFEIKDYQAQVPITFVEGVNSIEVKAGALVDRSVFQMDLIPQKLTDLSAKEIDLAMNLGAHFYFYDPIREQAWLPEKEYQEGSFGYVGGKRLEGRQWGTRVGVGQEIFGSDLEPIYQTHRDTIQYFKADIPDGQYEITLHLAEIYSAKDRKQLAYNLGGEGNETNVDVSRSFEIQLNDATPILMDDFTDFHALPIKKRIWVKSGKGLNIQFKANKSSAFLNGIEIRGF